MRPGKCVLWEVDVQVDFMLPGGKLYVPGAEKLAPKIGALVGAAMRSGVLIVSSADAHAANDPEFARFPAHCIKGTPGAELIPEGLAPGALMIPNDPDFALPRNIWEYPQVVLQKQTLDVFANPHASELVEQLGDEVEYMMFGVVTEFCVQCAAAGLLERGRKVRIVSDAIETLDAANGTRTIAELERLGATTITCEEALAKIEGVTASRG